jgi:hypothetical protein
MTKLSTSLFFALLFATPTAFAEDVDISSFEYVDVIETNDGSVLRGVILEQEPGVRYKLVTADGSIHVIQAPNVLKLTKARNKLFRGAEPVASERGYASDGGSSLRGRYEPRSKLPEPYAVSGIRADFDLSILFPGGDIELFDTSFAPTVRIGFEQMFGNFGLSGGGFLRWTYWMLPEALGDGNAAWTLETHAYAQAAFHLGRVVPYFGATLGTDLNYVYNDGLSMSDTALGFGTNIQFGVKVAATPLLTLGFGGDYHPGTDSAPNGSDDSVEYFALRLGAHMTL